jgi:hypothetical protein
MLWRCYWTAKAKEAQFHSLDDLHLDAPFEIDPESGILTFAELALALAPKQPLAAFLATDAGAHAEDGGCNGGWRRYHLRHDLEDGRLLSASLFFFNGCLTMVRFGYGSKSAFSWSGWSKKRELARDADYQNEIDRQLGRQGRFPWGVAKAVFDEKAGWARLVIKYE